MIIRRDVVKLALPVLAEQTFIMLMGVVNTIMAGHLGKEAISAIGMVDSLNMIFISFFSALAVGGTVVVAQYAGRCDFKCANDASVHTLYAGIALAAVISLVLFVFRHEVIELLYGKSEPLVLKYSLIYIGITIPTYPLIAITATACGVLRGAGDTGTPMKVTIIMNVLNVIFSYILIYGFRVGSDHFSFSIPAMGVKGAAIGIAAARLVGAVLIILTLLKGSKIIKLSFKDSFRLDFSMLGRIFGVGIPASVESLLFNGGKLITQIFIVGMGTASIASNYIAGSLFGLINIPALALSIVATTLVGQHMGRGENEKAKDTLIYLIKVASVCLGILCIIILPLSRALVSLYSSNLDVIKITVLILRTSILTMPLLWSLSFLLPAGLKGAGDAKYTMVISIASMWFFRITLGYILGVPLKLGVVGVWVGMYIDWLVRGFFFYIRLQNGKWMRHSVISSAEESM